MSEPGRRSFLRAGAAGALWPGLARAGADAAGGPARRLRVGQIGVAHGHASKLAVYRESPDYEVVGVVEPDLALRTRAASQPAFRGVTWMGRDELLGTPGLDAVLVETRVGESLDAAEACVAAGRHVHLDKPAGASLPRLRRLLDAAAERKLLVQLGYMYRYNPAIALLRELLRRGWLGEVFEVHAVMSKVVEPEERRRLAEFPGGMMFELGCHLIDVIVGLLGAPQGVTPSIQHAARVEDGLADNTLAVLTYPRAIATVKSSALEVDGFARRHLVVCGTEGTFHVQPLDDPAARLTLDRARPGYRQGAQEISFPRYRRYVADAADMARIIRGEKPADFSPAHDLAVQEALLRASGMPLDA